MKKHIILALAFFIYILTLILFGAGWGQKSRRSHEFKKICDLVDKKVYLDKKHKNTWYKNCLKSSEEGFLFEESSHLLGRVNSQLRSLYVSHLQIFTQEENKSLWSGVYKETGMSVINIGDRFFITRIYPNSPAFKAGLLLGDEILKINDEFISSVKDPTVTLGKYEIYRFNLKSKFIYHVGVKKINIDFKPELKPLNSKTAYLKISSFRSEYFNKKEWQKTIKQFLAYRSLIIDLRDNSGGSFVSVLRALSPLICKSTDIGRLKKAPIGLEKSIEFQDKFNESELLDRHSRYREIKLKTFKDYSCYTGRLVLLFNERTASVSEIFISALKEQDNVLLLGETSSGNVVLSVWYNIRFDLKKSIISIPEAVFIDSKGQIIEGTGVSPRIYLEYDIASTQKGLDSWVLRAQDHLSGL